MTRVPRWMKPTVADGRAVETNYNDYAREEETKPGGLTEEEEAAEAAKEAKEEEAIRNAMNPKKGMFQSMWDGAGSWLSAGGHTGGKRKRKSRKRKSRKRKSRKRKSRKRKSRKRRGRK